MRGVAALKLVAVGNAVLFFSAGIWLVHLTAASTPQWEGYYACATMGYAVLASGFWNWSLAAPKWIGRSPRQQRAFRRLCVGYGLVALGATLDFVHAADHHPSAAYFAVTLLVAAGATLIAVGFGRWARTVQFADAIGARPAPN